MKSPDGMIDIGDGLPDGRISCRHGTDKLIYACGICKKKAEAELVKVREAYRQALIIIGKCPQCHKSFGPQYTSFGNKPAEMICDCDGRRTERTHSVIVNETTIMQHIDTLDRR